MTRPPLLLSLALICVVAATWSGVGADDKGTWAFEVLPMTGVLLICAATLPRFRFTPLVYVLLVWFYLIQCVGGRYTFAEVPVPRAWLDALGLERNPVDRFGHFFQGFVPAIVVRELLLRRTPLHAGWTLAMLVSAVCLAFSASYELLEMATVLLFHADSGPEWLGMQGDPWDAQWDMAMALSGSIVAQVVLSRWHDHQIAHLHAA